MGASLSAGNRTILANGRPAPPATPRRAETPQGAPRSAFGNRRHYTGTSRHVGRIRAPLSPQRNTSRGRLSGIPYGVKDIVETRGLATEYGSPIYKGRIGTTDAAIIREMRKHGAILLGKTQTTAFAYQTPAPTRTTIPHLPPGCSRRAGGKRPWGVRERTGGPDPKNVPLGSRVVSQKVNFWGQGNKGRLTSSAVRRRTGEYPAARLLLPGGLCCRVPAGRRMVSFERGVANRA